MLACKRIGLVDLTWRVYHATMAISVGTLNRRRLRFRVENFDPIMAALGLTTDAEKARFLGIQQSQYTRAKNNTVQPSQVLIAQVLTALPRVPFEQLFELVDVDDKAAS